MTTNAQTSEGMPVIDDSQPFPGPCPSWCTLTPGHPIDALMGEERRPARGHNGPAFGKHLHASADEFLDEPGRLRHLVMLDDNAATEVTSPQDLIHLAADALKASIWLEQRNEEAR